jgi:protein SCO1/2
MKWLMIVAMGWLLAVTPAMAADPAKLAAIDNHAGMLLPLDLLFRDETGALVTLGTVIDRKPALFVPLLHNCPNICAVTLANLLEAVALQQYRLGRDFRIIAFSIDPRESPSDAAKSLRQVERAFPTADKGGLYGLTGSSDAIRQVTDALGYRYGWDKSAGQYAHLAATAVLTADGRLSRWLYGLAPEPRDLALGLTEAGQGRIGSWSDQLLLLCFHYDPQNGRYSSLINTALRVAALVTIGALGLLVFVMIRRDRTMKRAGR